MWPDRCLWMLIQLQMIYLTFSWSWTTQLQLRLSFVISIWQLFVHYKERLELIQSIVEKWNDVILRNTSRILHLPMHSIVNVAVYRWPLPNYIPKDLITLSACPCRAWGRCMQELRRMIFFIFWFQNSIPSPRITWAPFETSDKQQFAFAFASVSLIIDIATNVCRGFRARAMIYRYI